MPTRREMLFQLNSGRPSTSSIPATIRFRHNKRQGLIEALPAQEKMLCALRKVLTKMSDQDEDGCRYFIPPNTRVQLISPPTSTEGKKGEARTYRATGRCEVRLTHRQGHSSSMKIEFTVSFRDVKDQIGLADVECLEPTTIDLIPKSTVIA